MYTDNLMYSHTRIIQVHLLQRFEISRLLMSRRNSENIGEKNAFTRFMIRIIDSRRKNPTHFETLLNESLKYINLHFMIKYKL